MSKISTLVQSVEVTEVHSILVTDVVADEDDDGNPISVREIRVLYKENENAAEVVVFTLRVTASTADNIKLVAPEQTY